jgi:hypothetical protein
MKQLLDKGIMTTSLAKSMAMICRVIMDFKIVSVIMMMTIMNMAFIPMVYRKVPFMQIAHFRARGSMIRMTEDTWRAQSHMGLLPTTQYMPLFMMKG